MQLHGPTTTRCAPDASTKTDGNAAFRLRAKAANEEGVKLSNITMSAPARQPSATDRSPSTSDLGGAAAALLAVCTASGNGPGLPDVIVLQHDHLRQVQPGVTAPPTNSTYFSTMRNPGVVFLVPATMALPADRTAPPSTHFAAGARRPTPC